MIGEVLIIKFRENMAFLTDEIALDFTQVPVKIGGQPVPKFKEPAFWTVRVINYVPTEKRIYTEILKYQSGETKFPPNQLALTDLLVEIEKVTFRRVDTPGLLGTVNGNTGRTFLPSNSETVYRPEYQLHQEPKIPLKQNYTEPFSIPIKNVIFLDGKVSFQKKLQLFKKQVSFEIPNAHIIKAYDSIKNYFASVLKTKNIQVIPNIHAVDGEIVRVSANSAEIDRIDQSLIEEVKYEVVNTARKKDADGEPQILTIAEFLDLLNDEGVKGQELFKDEDDFINNLLERSGTKHHSPLLFLSSKHAHNLAKLRLVPKPLSFIFLLCGTDQLHVVWETLDTTEATYIWSFPKKTDVKQILKQVIDQTIKQILKEGKSAYLESKEENFTRVFHDYAEQYGFRIWKQEIEEILAL